MSRNGRIKDPKCGSSLENDPGRDDGESGTRCRAAAITYIFESGRRDIGKSANYCLTMRAPHQNSQPFLRSRFEPTARSGRSHFRFGPVFAGSRCLAVARVVEHGRAFGQMPHSSILCAQTIYPSGLALEKLRQGRAKRCVAHWPAQIRLFHREFPGCTCNFRSEHIA
jgi:hypothetical protein